jgi:P27 family predicted phage terminase small subunit
VGERGPKAKTSLKVLNERRLRYPNPQPGMTRNARTTWHRIVKAYPKDHFKPQHYDLLRAFCEASASHRKAILEMKKNGQVIKQANGVIKKSPWKDIEVQMNSTMATLSTKLGLSKNNTLVGRLKGQDGNVNTSSSNRKGLIYNG